jgi:hypothetical protein
VVVTVGLTETAVPLVALTGELPPVITPVPPEKVGVRLDDPPDVIVDGLAVKLVMTGAGFTVTIAVDVIAVPVVGVTVSV